MDYLFSSFGDMRIPLAAPRAYWLPQPFLMAGGPLVIDPRHDFWDRYYAPAVEQNAGVYPGDMDYLNVAFHDEITLLPGFNTMLIGEFMPGDKIFNHWGKYYAEDSSWVLDNAYSVHYIADWKPWKWTFKAIKAKFPDAPKELVTLYGQWYTYQTSVCSKS
eukprot:TRINITY_DN9183_c0_g1_i1.p1 TRINITY_DN9183_c0_g1~~TRINITY_DN9183_c0_g1_i1.p1  ORF type:complete len:161 (+),score=14.69 TRINITY_DN9183_c0_g1_i1:523-1005(+)